MDIFAICIIISSSSNVLLFYHYIKNIRNNKLKRREAFDSALGFSALWFVPLPSRRIMAEVCSGRTLYLKAVRRQRQSKEGRKGCSPSAPFKPHPQRQLFSLSPLLKVSLPPSTATMRGSHLHTYLCFKDTPDPGKNRWSFQTNFGWILYFLPIVKQGCLFPFCWGLMVLCVFWISWF